MRLNLGFFAHPVKAVDTLAKGRTQVCNQPDHGFLRFRREMTFDIDLTNRLAQRVKGTDTGHTALPAGLLFRLTPQSFAIEVEISLINLLRQHSGMVRYCVICQVGLPVCDRNFIHKCYGILQRLWAGHIELLHPINTASGEIGVPVKTGVVCLQLVHGGWVEILVAVTTVTA